MHLSSPKQLLLFVSLFIVFLVSGCGSDSKPQDASQSGVQLPSEITQLRLADNGGIHAYVQVDDGQKMPMSIDGDTAELQLNLSVGSHKISISFEFVQTSGPAKPVLLAEASKTITVNSSGNSPLNFLTTDFKFSDHDDDKDGFSNLSEMQSGSSAPVVESVTPANGSVDATTDTLIAVSFDDPINPKTLVGGVTVTGSESGVVAGNVSYDEPTHSVMFTPTNGLTDGDHYTVSIDTSVENTAGISLATMISWSFTVNDTAPAPSVLSVSPSDGSVDVAIDTSIGATFDSSMDESSLSSGFTVTGSGGAVSGSTTYDSSSLTATFTPSQPLNYGESYTATLGTAIQNSSGVALTTVASWGFTTIDANSYTVSGTVSGLIGNGLVLQNNDGDDLSISTNGSFTFATALVDGSNYSVTVATQPSSPNQICSVINASGALGANVSNISVVCATDSHTIGGTVSGLSGSGLVLQNNVGDDLTISANGSYTFPTELADGSDFSVTVATQPSTPNQICAVTNSSGTLDGVNVSNVSVVCTTNSYTIGGTVSGLSGTGLTLQNNAGDDLTISANGSFTFATALVDGSDYNVAVATQPSTPNQTCAITNGRSTLAGANVSDVSIVCVTNTYSIGGTVSGLSGSGLVLKNNEGDNLSVANNGAFTFSTELTDSSSYSISIFSQPKSPNQVCSISNGSGTLSGSSVTNISINCVNSYSIGGSVSGVLGDGLILQNNGGDDLNITSEGAFSFSGELTDSSSYSVTIVSQPTNPNQVCSLSNAAGEIAASNVTDVNINCITNTYTISGSVTGLLGSGLELQNNGADNLSIVSDGSFAFPTALDDSTTYNVTVLNQPGAPAQSCYVNNGSATLAGANVTDINVICPHPAPENLRIFSGFGGQNVLSWDAVPDAVQYTLYWNTTGDVSSSDNAINIPVSTSYTHDYLTDGTKYYYRLAVQTSVNDYDSLLTDEVSSTSGTLKWVNPQPNGDISFTDIAWNGTTYIATSSDGIYSSSDLTNWTQVISGRYSGVIWSDSQSLFVAVGRSGVAVSLHGTEWNFQDSGVSSTLNSVAWLGGQYLAVGDAGTIITSPDAINWTIQPTDYSNTNLNDISWNGTTYVAVGSNYTTSSDTILTSTDGTGWVSQGLSFSSSNIQSIAWTGTQFVTVGVIAEESMSSLDGYTWSPLAGPGSGNEVIWTGSQLVAVSGFSILTSPDGDSWNASVAPSGSYNTVRWLNDELIALTSDGAIVISSDGSVWSPSNAVIISDLKDMNWNGDQFVAVSSDGEVVTSPDGITWSIAYSGSASYLWSVAWSGTQYVAVGSNISLTSPDGINWTEHPLSLTRYYKLTKVIWGYNQFLAVGDKGGIITSSDGVNWTEQVSGVSIWLQDITWNESISQSQYVVVGDISETEGTILTSSDGVTWVKQVSGVSSDLRAITWSGSQYVTASDRKELLSSSDAINWTGMQSGSLAGYALDIIWAEDKFITVENGGFSSFSYDGLNWLYNRTRVYPSYLFSIVWDGSKFVMVGSDGAILVK